MSQKNDWKDMVGQQLQVANQQIALCQQEIQQEGDSPSKQMYLQNALGAVAKAWSEIEESFDQKEKGRIF